MAQDNAQRDEWTHDAVVRRLAGEMFRGAMWAALATVVVCLVVWTVVAGATGLVSALIGGVIACLSSVGTLVLMRKTAALPVQFVMVAALGGFMGKLILLFCVLLLLRRFPELHVNALALTTVATIVVTTFMEVRASKRSRSQMVIPTPGNT
ncbi:ATP synthase subunit I [Saccharothrix longispora]|uniref:ATP synthase subunit I n=1 Tax=Saccharothrix longispora TaxID=33920 RepID=UPI0028FD15B6|nr:ATP synthase subunit I [Saccharothrix longispora]MDU0289974.1 ATP synthase subunit I [Saccharothrix longispora]